LVLLPIAWSESNSHQHGELDHNFACLQFRDRTRDFREHTVLYVALCASGIVEHHEESSNTTDMAVRPSLSI
jgi:hypothetical protein